VTSQKRGLEPGRLLWVAQSTGLREPWAAAKTRTFRPLMNRPRTPGWRKERKVGPETQRGRREQERRVPQKDCLEV
jgi:hypothetical protein